MTGIDKLIYDALAGRRSVSLPGVGTLEIKRRGAKKISDTQIMPPQNVVAFTSGETVEGAENVVSLIAAAGVSNEEAVAMYGLWLDGARRSDGSIAIEDVGEIARGGFVVAEPLHSLLNPINEEIVTMETSKKSTPLWVWIVIAALAALLVAGGIWCCKKGVFGSSKQPAVETVVSVAPPADSLATASAASTAVVKQTSGPRFHVIAGAFAIESNADNFIAKLKREHSELTLEKVVNPENGYNMVSIFQAPTRRAASNKMNLYWDIDLYLWIYEQK